MSNIQKIDSEVPFGQLLYVQLRLRDLNIDSLKRQNRIETPYLAWETVRKQINPFFQNGTGFEGYLVGRYSDPEAALDAILAINQNVLDAITRLYRFQYGFRSQMMKTLTKESTDPKAIHIWSASLGAELGKLRAQILNDPKAQAFRHRTYEIIKSLPPMVYHESEQGLKQTYAIGTGNTTGVSRISVTLSMLKPDQQDAWLVAENIGEFGHPLVRTVLDRE